MKPRYYSQAEIDAHLLKVVKEINREVCKNKRTATAFLIEAGILDKNGKLSKRYQS